MARRSLVESCQGIQGSSGLEVEVRDIDLETYPQLRRAISGELIAVGLVLDPETQHIGRCHDCVCGGDFREHVLQRTSSMRMDKFNDLWMCIEHSRMYIEGMESQWADYNSSRY